MLTPVIILLIVVIYCLEDDPLRDVKKAEKARHEAELKAMEYLRGVE